MNVYDNVTLSFDVLMHMLSTSEIILVDGFKDVGKQQLVKQLAARLRYETPNGITRHIFEYRPDYDTYGYANFVEIKDRFLLRLPVLEFFASFKEQFQSPSSEVKLIMDKSVISDIVHGLLLNQITFDEATSILQILVPLIINHKTCVVHVTQSAQSGEDLVNKDSILRTYLTYSEYLVELGKADVTFFDILYKLRSLFPELATNLSTIKYYIGDQQNEDTV